MKSTFTNTLLILLVMIGYNNSFAQTGSLNITANPANCSGLGSVTAIVSVPGQCSVNEFAPCTNFSLHGPNGNNQIENGNTCHQYQVGRPNLQPGDYYYKLTAISPCSGSVEIPFTIEDQGAYPNIEITLMPVDCSNDDYVTVDNNSWAEVSVSVLNGNALGTVAAGQSEDFVGAEYNIVYTAYTSSCPTPVEFPLEYQTGPGLYPFGFPMVQANTSYVDASGGMSNGSATVNITSGSGPFEISWSNGVSVSGEITSTIDNLAPDTYTVTVTDAKGCTFTEDVVISGGMSGIDALSSVFGSVSIAPNPVRDDHVLINMDAFHNKNVGISILNSLGQEVIGARQFTVSQGNNRVMVDLTSNLNNGMYFVKITVDNKVGAFPMLYQNR